MALRDLYDAWAPTYPPEAHNPLMRAEQAVVTRYLTHAPRCRVLDAGAGTGRYTPTLLESGAALVVSCDWSLMMLRGQRHAAARVCADVRHLPFDDASFDLINASLVAGDLPDLGAWVAELARVLAPGGRVVYSDFHPQWHRHGWQRTFRDVAGRSVTLPCAPHALETHHEAWSSAGLRLLGMHEVHVAPPRSRFQRWRHGAPAEVPALLVVAVARPERSR
jgi:ubiquinone/menaquinone biosynthesis C-methylase UbiE